MQCEVDVGGANVRHFRLVQEQPRYRTTDDGELTLEAAEDLSDFDEDAPNRRGGAVFVVAGGLGFYSIHGSASFAR